MVSLGMITDTLNIDLKTKVDNNLYLIPKETTMKLGNQYIKSSLTFRKFVSLVDILHDQGYKIVEITSDDFKKAFNKYPTCCHTIDEGTFQSILEHLK